MSTEAMAAVRTRLFGENKLNVERYLVGRIAPGPPASVAPNPILPVAPVVLLLSRPVLLLRLPPVLFLLSS